MLPRSHWIRAAGVLALLGPAPRGFMADVAEEFAAKIRPILVKNCFECHDAEKQKGDLNLARFESYDAVTAEPETWQHVLEQVQSDEMPPKNKGKFGYGERQTMMQWLRRLPKPEAVDCNQLASDRTASFYRGYVMSRRLNRDEYFASVRDLFGVEFPLPFDELLPKDGGGGEGFDTSGDALFLSSIHVEKYLTAADRVVRALLPEDPRALTPALQAARARLLGAGFGKSQSPDDGARAVLTPLARRAWRRPVSDDEIDRLLTLYRRGRERGDSPVPSLRLPLQALLVSPHFLFLAEPEPARPGIHRLADVPLASKLSYFLWSSTPDETLLSLAEQGKLSDPAVYRGQIERMLQDPKAAALGQRFALQWLDLGQLGADVKPDPVKYPEFDDALAAAMKSEVATFFNQLFRERRSLLELLDSDYTYVNERLARLYGLDGVTGAEFRRVPLADARRGGVTGMAGVHALTSYPLRTSPVLRGRWVLEALLGDRIKPPPPEVPALDEEKMKTDGLSLRRQLELHRENANCAACHDKMDPLGFGLENFDVLGRWRTEDHGQPLDTTGTLPTGETYAGPDGLRKVLLQQKDKVLRHLAKKLTGFALGRELNKFDQCVIDQAMVALEKQGYRADVLVETIATSYPFQYRFYPKGDSAESEKSATQ